MSTPNIPTPGAPASAPAPSSAPSPSSSSTPSTPPSASSAGPQQASRGIDSRVQNGATEQTPAAGKTATEAQKAVERIKLRLKIDGREEEREFDPEQLAVHVQKAGAADKRMQEAAQIRKSFQAIVERLKQDPFEVLSDPAIGVDLEALAEKRLADKYRKAMMSDEERAVYERQQEYERIKSENDRYKRAEQQRRQTEIDRKVFQETEQNFKTALGKVGLPPSYELLREMAKIARDNLQFGIELSPAQLAAEVRSHVEGTRTKLEEKVRTSLKGEELIKYLGEDVVREILRAQVAKVRAKQSTLEPVPPPAPEGSGARLDGRAWSSEAEARIHQPEPVAKEEPPWSLRPGSRFAAIPGTTATTPSIGTTCSTPAWCR